MVVSKKVDVPSGDSGSTVLPTFEGAHVHDVYNAVAAHFSDTRYKPWPVVQAFIDRQEKGSVGADVGCGNGKYLLAAEAAGSLEMKRAMMSQGKHKSNKSNKVTNEEVTKDEEVIVVNGPLFCVGSDRSTALVDICVRERKLEALVADGLSQPFRSGTMDFALSIAVIHHFSSPERRRDAIAELVRILRVGGQALVYVWAFEQSGRRKFEAQDVFVPWHMPSERYGSNPTGEDSKDPKSETVTNVDGKQEKVFQRYYHLFVEGEVESLVREIPGARVAESGYDRDNWWVVVHKDH